MEEWDKFVEKLRKLALLRDGAATPGERDAAVYAMDRIRERMGGSPPTEFSFSMPDMWSRKLLVAILRRYGVTPYRYSRQRYTTVMAKVSKEQVNEKIWPEYLEVAELLNGFVADLTDRVINDYVHKGGGSDVEVRPGDAATRITDGKTD